MIFVFLDTVDPQIELALDIMNIEVLQGSSIDTKKISNDEVVIYVSSSTLTLDELQKIMELIPEIRGGFDHLKDFTVNLQNKSRDVFSNILPTLTKKTNSEPPAAAIVFGSPKKDGPVFKYSFFERS